MKIKKTVLTSIVILILFLGTYISKLPFILLGGIFLSVILIILELLSLTRNKSQLRMADKKILLVLLANFFYWLLSGLLVGSFALSDMLTYDFWQGTGRIFITHIPFIFFCLYFTSAKDHIKEIKLSVNIIAFLSVISILLMFVYLGSHPDFLQKGKNYISLLTGHTSAGTYFGYLSSFLIVYGYESKQNKLTWLGILTTLPLIASGGRGALLSFFATLAIYFSQNFRLKTIIQIFFGVTIGSFIIYMVFVNLSPDGYLYGIDRLSSLGSQNVWQQAQDIIQASNWQPGYDRGFDSEETADSNVLARILYWVYAVKEFIDSPIIGIGWDRFADINITQYGIKGFVYLATEGQKVFDAPGGAHNAYLTFLCETGIVGLGLNLWFWFEVLKKLKHNELYCQEYPKMRAFLKTCKGQVYYLLVASMTGHVLAAPTAGIPVLLLVGLGNKLSSLKYLDNPRNIPTSISVKNVKSKSVL